MRKTLLAVLALVFVLSVSATAQNLIFNGDFEFDDPTAGWIINGAGIMAPGDWSIPIHTGNFAGIVNSWDGDWSAPKGTIQQVAYGLTAGNYDLSLDYYIGARSGEAFRNAGIVVKVNGEEVFSEFIAPELQWSGYFSWKSAVVPVAITGDTADVVVEYHSHFAEWTWLGADNISLTESTVPEPGSILALLSGVIGMGGLAIRRRK